MKFNISFPFLITALLLPFLCFSQQWGPPFPPGEKEAYEKQDDPYLSNAYNNQKLSPAYRDDGRSGSRTSYTEVFTRLVIVSLNYQSFLDNAPNSSACIGKHMFFIPANW